MSRGRLIYPILAELAQLDTVATEALDPDGAGPLTSGYDDEFREDLIIDPGGDSSDRGVTARQEKTPIQLRCQYEEDTATGTAERMAMMQSGDAPKSLVRLVFAMKDLERLGMIDPKGQPTIRKNDRLIRTLTTGGVEIEVYENPPGLYVTEVQSRSFGLSTSNATRNLLLVTFEDRAQSVAGAA